MTKRIFLLPVLALAIQTGCGVSGLIDSADQLTTEQINAILASLDATQGISDSAEAVSPGVASEDEQNSKAANADLLVNFGTCPAVTLETDDQGNNPPSLTVDFGNGCAPNAVETTTECSGSATGTITFFPREITLAFSDFGCGQRNTDGDVELSWSRANNTVTVDGSWDLTVTPNDGIASTTEGSGTATYDNSTRSTTISTYNGMLTRAGNTWTTELDGVQVSYQNNANLIPFAGTATITGTRVGTVVATFNDDSPTTRVIFLSINGGPAFEYEIPSE